MVFVFVFIIVFFGQVMCPCHSDQMSQRSQVSRIALWRYFQNVFDFIIVSVFVIVFFWSGHVSSSLLSNVAKVTSLWNRSLKVFSKCICFCHCLCLFFVVRSCLLKLWSNVSKITSLQGHSVAFWRLWLLVVPNQGSKEQGHLESCSGQLKNLKGLYWKCSFKIVSS